MAENCGFFDAHVQGNEYDRVYLAHSFAAYFASFIGNGVFGANATQLQVVADTDNPGMRVKIHAGQGWINGYWYENTSDLTLPIANADGVLNRIDSIVLRWGRTERAMWLAVKKGTFAANPVAPSNQRDADYYELTLAHVSIRAGAVDIFDSDITDKRLDTNVCGVVTGLIKQIDAEKYGYQLNTFISRYIAKAETDYEYYYIKSLDDLKTRARAAYDEFITWLASLKANTNNQVISFITWLSDYRASIIRDVTDLETQLHGLITSEVASALAARITELENKNPVNIVANINHGLGDYPHCDLYEYTWGWGIGGAGEGPAGGGSLISVPNFSYEMPSDGNIKIKVGNGYGVVESVNKIDTGLYAIVFKNNTTSLIVKLKLI